MGFVATINLPLGLFPRQSDRIGRRVEVCFHYDATKRLGGVIVRDDITEPGETLIQIDDGPILRAVECQYSYSDG